MGVATDGVGGDGGGGGGGGGAAAAAATGSAGPSSMKSLNTATSLSFVTIMQTNWNKNKKELTNKPLTVVRWFSNTPWNFGEYKKININNNNNTKI